MKKRLARRKKMHFEVIFVGGVSDGEVRTCGGVHQRFQIWESVHWRFWFVDIMPVFMIFKDLEEIDGEMVVSVLKLFAEKEKKKKSICHW